MEKLSPIKKSANFEFYKLPELTEHITVRLVSSPVHAGFPSPADDYIEDVIDLNNI